MQYKMSAYNYLYKPYLPQFTDSGNMVAAGGATYGSTVDDVELATQIRHQIELNKAKVSETGTELDRCRHEQEAFSVEYYTFRENNVKYESMQQQVSSFLPASS
jgi:hypothetical protein